MTTPIRLHHLETNQRFVVDDGKVYADKNGDGKIAKSEELTSDPKGTSRAELAEAASYLAKTFEPAARGGKTTDGRIESGGQLNSQEVDAFQKGGVVPARSDLKAHLDFFDLNRDGKASLGEMYKGCRSLGYSKVTSAFVAGGSAVIFGILHGSTSVDIEDIGHRRPANPTGIYDQAGNIDQAKLGQYTAEFDLYSSDGKVTFDKFKQLLAETKSDLGLVPKRQFKTLMDLCQRLNSDDYITKQQFVGLFDGSLLYMAKGIHHTSG